MIKNYINIYIQYIDVLNKKSIHKNKIYINEKKTNKKYHIHKC